MGKPLHHCFAFLLVMTFVVFIFIIFSDEHTRRFLTIHHKFTPRALLNLNQSQEDRRSKITEICAAERNLSFTLNELTKLWIPTKALDHLIVNKKHKIIYCYVPKVACSNWKRVMMVLSQAVKSPDGTPYRKPLDIPSVFTHNISLHLTLNKVLKSRYVSRSSLQNFLRNYTKFIFVREPFLRIISAYRDKFGRDNEYFYQKYGKTILQRYAGVSKPPATSKEALATGKNPTFAHFIKYLLDPQTEKTAPFNEHWQQVYRLCHPCQIHYDFIGKLESLDRDSESLLQILQMESQISFPRGSRNKTTKSSEDDWFARISLSDKRKLYKLFEADFQLFGYDKPDTL